MFCFMDNREKVFNIPAGAHEIKYVGNRRKTPQ